MHRETILEIRKLLVGRTVARVITFLVAIFVAGAAIFLLMRNHGDSSQGTQVAATSELSERDSSEPSQKDAFQNEIERLLDIDGKLFVEVASIKAQEPRWTEESNRNPYWMYDQELQNILARVNGSAHDRYIIRLSVLREPSGLTQNENANRPERSFRETIYSSCLAPLKRAKLTMN